MDLHVHFPEGAVPKDGPSAGVTISTSLVSALLQVPVRKDVAMTGEINLRGRVLPIGGLKEKLLAAYRAEMKTVICPKENEKDLHDVPKHVIKSMELVFASTIDEVLRVALVKPTGDLKNKSLLQFLTGDKLAPQTDWREAREYIERRNKEQKQAGDKISH